MLSITEFIHILLATAALVASCITALQALVLAIQEKSLRYKRIGQAVRQLPSLEVMEKLLFQSIAISFVLLTLVLLSGASLLPYLLTVTHLWHKTLLSCVAWLVFMILLLGRRYRGWRGQIAIRWTLLGVLLITMSYLGAILLNYPS